MLRKKNYSKRVWLNSPNSPSTGSVVAYKGESPWSNKGDYSELTLLEIADCHNKVRLHKSDLDTDKDFIRKLERLESVIHDFIIYLKTNQPPL